MTRLAAVLAHAGSLFLPSAGLPGTEGPTDQSQMLLLGMGFLHVCWDRGDLYITEEGLVALPS